MATLKIPIDVNGLRANNETYTFNVYGYVDLDDGYGSTNQLIGTFNVNTNNIKSFLLESSVNDSSLTKTFEITSQLKAINGEDNTLEANTLTNLTFNLTDEDYETIKTADVATAREILTAHGGEPSEWV